MKLIMMRRSRCKCNSCGFNQHACNISLNHHACFDLTILLDDSKRLDMHALLWTATQGPFLLPNWRQTVPHSASTPSTTLQLHLMVCDRSQQLQGPSEQSWPPHPRSIGLGTRPAGWALRGHGMAWLTWACVHAIGSSERFERVEGTYLGHMQCSNPCATWYHQLGGPGSPPPVGQISDQIFLQGRPSLCYVQQSSVDSIPFWPTTLIYN